jgi:hypothetical protein
MDPVRAARHSTWKKFIGRIASGHEKARYGVMP